MNSEVAALDFAPSLRGMKHKILFISFFRPGNFFMVHWQDQF